MKKTLPVILGVLVVASAVAIAYQHGQFGRHMAVGDAGSEADPERPGGTSSTSGKASFAGAEVPQTFEISKRGPGMRRQSPAALKLPIPRTFDLTHVTADNFADALGKDPVRIFNYVRDEIAYEVYTGCLRGPRGTLLAMAGNSVDRALLLASMLQHAGQRVRYARGTLPEAEARELVTSMWAERPRPAELGGKGDPPLAVKVARDTLVAGVERDYTLIRDQLKKANLKITPDLSPSLNSLIKEARDYWWVQWWRDGGWVDLDPSFGDSSPGQKYAPLQETFDALPDSLFHHVEIRVRLEEYVGDHPSNRMILTYKTKAAGLSGADVVLTHQPENWKGPAASLQAAMASAIQDTGRVKPVLSVRPKDWVAGEPFCPKQPSTAGIGGVFNALAGAGTRHDVPIATAESIEFDFIAPGGAKETVVREIFDVVGNARRMAAGQPLRDDEVRARTEGDNAFDPTAGIYSLFFTTGLIDPGHLRNLSNETAETPSGALSVSNLLHAVDINFWRLADATRFQSRGRSVLVSYPDSPRLQITAMTRRGNSRSIALDLRRYHSRMVTGPSDPPDVVHARLLGGVWNGTIERVLGEYVAAAFNPRVRPKVSFGASAMSERAKALNLQPVLLREGSALPKVLPDTQARLHDELAKGYWAIAPPREIDFDGKPRFAWWRLDPRSGETVAVSDEGLYGEYMMVHVGQPTEGTYVIYQSYLDMGFEAGPVLTAEGEGFVAGSNELGNVLCRALRGVPIIFAEPAFPWTTYFVF